MDVVLLEKSEFPREKVRGDGLTPRAVEQLVRMGIDLSAPGWTRNRGLTGRCAVRRCPWGSTGCRTTAAG
jgi:2-polyprenyl-6-methoxyphenol hydroxylase-like FAD-dependent oxidoreductase